jgi:hypothetical protein
MPNCVYCGRPLEPEIIQVSEDFQHKYTMTYATGHAAICCDLYCQLAMEKDIKDGFMPERYL